jgi:hypothetical protein
MKRHILFFPLALAVFGAGCFVGSPSVEPTATPTPLVEPTEIPAEITVFVSKTCPHCAIIESLVKNGQMAKALPVTFKEVSDDANLRLFVEKAKACKLDLALLGVPMLWDGSRCYDGQDKIQAYLEKLMKLYEKNRPHN